MPSALSLYRHLLRYGNRLQLTDKSWYLARIRTEFDKYRLESRPDVIAFQVRRARALLDNDRLR